MKEEKTPLCVLLTGGPRARIRTFRAQSALQKMIETCPRLSSIQRTLMTSKRDGRPCSPGRRALAAHKAAEERYFYTRILMDASLPAAIPGANAMQCDLQSVRKLPSQAARKLAAPLPVNGW